MPDDILELVYGAIDDSDACSADGTMVEKTPHAELLGGDKGVDSLTFVNLIVAIEERIQTVRGISVVLVDENSLELQEHPFRTVGTLAAYVQKVLDKK